MGLQSHLCGNQLVSQPLGQLPEQEFLPHKVKTKVTPATPPERSGLAYPGQVLLHHKRTTPSVLLDHSHPLQGTWNSSYPAEPSGLFPESLFSKLSPYKHNPADHQEQRSASGPG